jgi:hypothetical protein
LRSTPSSSLSVRLLLFLLPSFLPRTDDGALPQSQLSPPSARAGTASLSVNTSRPRFVSRLSVQPFVRMCVFLFPSSFPSSVPHSLHQLTPLLRIGFVLRQGRTRRWNAHFSNRRLGDEGQRSPRNDPIARHPVHRHSHLRRYHRSLLRPEGRRRWHRLHATAHVGATLVPLLILTLLNSHSALFLLLRPVTSVSRLSN